MKIRFNELEDFVRAIKKTSIRVIYSDVIPRYTSVKQSDGKEITRIVMVSKLTATDDKTYLACIRTIAQQDIVSEASYQELNQNVTKFMDTTINKLHDDLPAYEVISGEAEPNLIA